MLKLRPIATAKNTLKALQIPFLRFFKVVFGLVLTKKKIKIL